MSHVDEGLLHAYLDGELTPVERARVDEHLAGCAACRTRLDEERGLIERACKLLGLAMPADRPAPPFSALARQRRWWHVRLPLAWAATVILAIGLGWKLSDTNWGTPREVETLGGPIAVRQSQPAPAQLPAAPATGRIERRRDQSPAAKQTQPPALANNAPIADTTRAEEKAAAPPAVAAGAGVTAAMPAPPVARSRSLAPRAQAMERDELVTVALDSATARAILGREPLVIPGLAVRRITRSPRATDEIQVEQALDSTQVVVLWERRRLGRESHLVSDSLTRAVEQWVVQIQGAVGRDSLNKLLAKIK